MRPRGRLLCSIAVSAMVVSGCGSDGNQATTTTDEGITSTSRAVTTTTVPVTTTTASITTTTSAPAPTGVVAYFLLDELEDDAGGPYLVPVYREVSYEGDVALASLETLVSGPTDDEAAGTPSMSTALPEATTILGVSVEEGLATADFSDEFDDGGGSFSMFARLAQVVYTLTRIDGIDQVEILIEGEVVPVFSSEGIELDGPQERSDYYDQLPPIFVDHPAWGELVTSPFTVSGLSNVFEAVSQVMLTDDDGLPLFEDMVMASCGTGCWGEWGLEIPYEVDRDQFGSLIVWEFSAQDGSRIHVREYPVQLR